MSRNLTSLARVSALLLALTALVACSPPAVPQIEAAVPGRTAKWSKSTLEAAARIPIQEGGRVKPLDTFARFQLLEISGKRSLNVAINGEEQDMSALEWLLDTLFFPRQAADYPVFLVED